MESTNLKIDKEVLKVVADLTKELFELIGLKPEIEIVHDKENEAIMVNLKSDDSTGLIIGRRGETISAIQSVLGMMVRQKAGGWVRIMLNIGDWREKQEEQLKELATSAAQRARETGEAQMLYNLSASQRRVIHMTLSEEKDIKTESEGEGRDRHLVINLK